MRPFRCFVYQSFCTLYQVIRYQVIRGAPPQCECLLQREPADGNRAV